jgi:hypothetical protein
MRDKEWLGWNRRHYLEFTTFGSFVHIVKWKYLGLEKN